VSSRPTSPPNFDGSTLDPSSETPSFAALNISTESWTVFNTHPKYHATAYIKLDISCIPHPNITNLTTSTLGHLHDLSLHLSLSGPGTTLSHYGNLTHTTLLPASATTDSDGHWINLLHIGIKDTSLASKLSTSFRTISRSASRSIGKSAGRFGKYTNIDLINKWLTILESDTPEPEREPVIVHAIVKYRHSLLPSNTELRDRVSCRVKMTRDEMERGVLSSTDLNLDISDSARSRTVGTQRRVVGSWYGQGRKVERLERESDDDDEDEERIQEARVLGAPWL
jgi:hypothetical protein